MRRVLAVWITTMKEARSMEAMDSGRMRDVIRLYQKFKYVGICTTVEVVNESGHLDSVG